MFDIIYNYFQSLFNTTKLNSYSTTILGQTTTLGDWLSVTTTIVVLILLVVVLCLAVRWAFKLFINLFRLH